MSVRRQLQLNAHHIVGLLIIFAIDHGLVWLFSDNSHYILWAYGVWLAIVIGMYQILGSPRCFRYVQTAAVILAFTLLVLLPTYRHLTVLEWIWTLQRQRITSQQAHLYSAIRDSELPYEEKAIRSRFTDDNHHYLAVQATFYDVGARGIVDITFQGITTAFRSDHPIRFPFGSNVQLPFDVTSFLTIEDLTSGKPQAIRPNVSPVPTPFRTYLYAAEFPDFEGAFTYRRQLRHPASQTFNPDAFLLYLDLVKGEIDMLDITLYANCPLSRVLLQSPARYDADESMYTWRDPDLASVDGPITDPAVLAKASSRLGELGGPIVAGYKIKISKPIVRRLFLIYFKGRTTSETFLGSPATSNEK
jgi:hypothetical protein